MATERNFSMVEYFKLREEKHQPKMRFAVSDRRGFDTWRRDLFSRVKDLLGPMPRQVPLNPEVVWELAEDGLIKRRVVFDTEAEMSVPALLYIPKAQADSPAPAILCNHGHGAFGKDSVMGVRSGNAPERDAEIERYNYDYGLQMAKRGYVTMAIDYRPFGERSDGGDPYPGRDKCNVHFVRGSVMGINVLALDVHDAMRALDYLCSLDCVDSDRIGAMGLSFGGTMTTWISLMDQRIKAADIMCYSARFKTFGIEKGNFCGSQMVPGLYDLCDLPDLHGLIAPRPLLAEVGAHDQCFTADEAISCTREVAKIYAAAGVSENYEVDLFDGDHRFAGNKAFAFFDKHLKA